MRRRRLSSPLLLPPLLLLLLPAASSALVLLEDLPTPSFLIDVQAMQRAVGIPGEAPIPRISLPNSSLQLVPQTNDPKYSSRNDACPHIVDDKVDPIEIFGGAETPIGSPGDVCYGYIHSRVVRTRQEKLKDEPSTFLAELDVALSSNVKAHLVLGLNNHHVVSYYWARSAGTGAAMEAPGVLFDGGCLRWESTAGFTDCNSNDGKRSEWVNFLRVGDNVQLRPEDPGSILLEKAFVDRVYGVSALGRPLGSEPVVVCEWKILCEPSAGETLA